MEDFGGKIGAAIDDHGQSGGEEIRLHGLRQKAACTGLHCLSDILGTRRTRHQDHGRARKGRDHATHSRPVLEAWHAQIEQDQIDRAGKRLLQPEQFVERSRFRHLAVGPHALQPQAQGFAIEGVVVRHDRAHMATRVLVGHASGRRKYATPGAALVTKTGAAAAPVLAPLEAADGGGDLLGLNRLREEGVDAAQLAPLFDRTVIQARAENDDKVGP